MATLVKERYKLKEVLDMYSMSYTQFRRYKDNGVFQEDVHYSKESISNNNERYYVYSDQLDNFKKAIRFKKI